MNTVQIQCLLNKDLFAKTIFKKVCAKNQLQRVDYPSAYVINSHPSSKPVEHWIAVYFDKHGKEEYFDSCSLPPSVNGFTMFMERNSKTWIYNDKTVQSLFSTMCGHYCVYFILYRCRGYSMHYIVSHFSSNLTENDRKVDLFIHTLSLM